MSRKYVSEHPAAWYRAVSRGDDPNVATSTEHERPKPLDHAEGQQKHRAEDKARAGRLAGAIAGPWAVTGINAEGWVEVTHTSGTKRLMKAYAAEDLLRRARRNGLASVRAQRPRPAGPIESIPVYALGDPSTDI